jgi:23S rRNA G2445 N2-methylase RlmL
MALRYIASVTSGLEWVAADEISTLPAFEQLRIAPGTVEFFVTEPTPELHTIRTINTLVVEQEQGQRHESLTSHDWLTEPAQIPLPVTAALSRLASQSPGAHIADPFCGRGILAIEIARTIPESTVYGSDLDAERLMHARENAERAGVKVTFEVADAVAPLWRTDSLDAVITSPPWRLQMHSGGAAADAFAPVWSEVRRGLKETGVLCIVAADYLQLAASVPGHLFKTHLIQQIQLPTGPMQIAVFSPSDIDPLRKKLRAWHNFAIEFGIVPRS